MNQCDRIRLILQENKLKQKDLAAEIGVTESYISVLLKKPEIRLSRSIAVLIEEKYGYRAEWVMNGGEPRFRQTGGGEPLSQLHRRALARLEKMNDAQVKAVLAFINSLDDIEKALTGRDGSA